MKSLVRSRLPGLLTGLLAIAASATCHATRVGQFSCAQNNISANLSFYDLGATNTLAPGGTVGKVVINPLEFHTSVVNFQQFFSFVSTGIEIPGCTLVIHIDNETITYTLQNVEISDVTAVAQSETAPGQPPTSYLDVVVTYLNLSVQAAGPDTGGTSPSPVGVNARRGIPATVKETN